MQRTQENNSSQHKSKDSFKPLFCNSVFYMNNQVHFQWIFHQVLDLNKYEIQKVILWCILLTIMRRPGDWYGGSHLGLDSKTLDLDLSSKLNTDQIQKLKAIELSLKTPFEMISTLELGWPKSLNPKISWSLFIQHVKIKPLPDRVTKALNSIFHDQYPVHVLSYEPTPLELLAFQAKGIRVITFQEPFTEWPTLLYGLRDPLSFWLHDCIHAEHFFATPESLMAQKGFYIFITHCLNHEILDYQNLTSPFKDQFDYLISDMNAHPLHLLKTFKAIIDIYLKDSPFIWEKISTQLSITLGANSQESIGLQHVNSDLFTKEDCQYVLQFIERLGAQGYL